MVNSLKKVDLKVYEYDFDFSKNIKDIFNLEVYSDKLQGSVGFEISDMPVNCKDATEIKLFDGNTYMRLNDGYLYVWDGSFQRIGDLPISNDFILLKVDFNGAEHLLVASGTNSFLTGNGNTFILDFKSRHVEYAFGRVIYFYNDTIYFTKPYDYFSPPEIAIKINSNSGEFRKFCLLHDDLFIVCQNCIYKISRFSSTSDVCLDVVPVHVENIVANTIVVDNGYIYFMQNRVVSKFDGSKIENFKTCIHSSDYVTYVTESGVCSGVISVIVGKIGEGKKSIYQFDTTTEKQRLIDRYGTFYPNHLACVDSDGNIMFLGQSGERDVIYNSKQIDFGNKKNKSLLLVSGFVSAPTWMTITGENSKRKLYFKKGYNEIFCNLKSVDFSVDITSNGEYYAFHDLKFKYTTEN